jgi:ribulose-phosphate 3-epimerase
VVKVYPSLLAADFARLAEDIRSVEAAADGLHLDVMDGQFVPNLTFGPMLVEAVNRLTAIHLNVHLMIRDPLALASRFITAGADTLTVHVEAVDDPAAALREIRKLGAKAGISLNPETPFDRIERALGDADEVLVMSVHPGYGGQAFLPETLDKVRRLKALKTAGTIAAEISIDGGINRETSRLARETGAEALVAGAAVFGAADRAAEIAAIRGT